MAWGWWAEQGHGGSSPGGVGEPAVPGAGSGLHCRGTAPTSHMQCNSNAPRGRPLSRPHAPLLPHCTPHRSSGGRGAQG